MKTFPTNKQKEFKVLRQKFKWLYLMFEGKNLLYLYERINSLFKMKDLSFGYCITWTLEQWLNIAFHITSLNLNRDQITSDGTIE